MVVVFSLFTWWYTAGWLSLVHRASDRVQALLGFFSVPLLVSSLFAPFRQISAERVSGPLSVQLAAFGDRLFSRCIGMIVRLFLIIVGLATVAVFSALCLLVVITWPLLPAAPLIGFLFGGGR